jgi:hypothetical protein
VQVAVLAKPLLVSSQLKAPPSSCVTSMETLPKQSFAPFNNVVAKPLQWLLT